MNEKVELTPAQAEEMRLALKEMGWALAHLRNFYNLSKTEDAPVADDPNQLKLFDQ
jgi:hypothetical protein